MRDFRHVVARLRAFQSKFESLLSSARGKTATDRAGVASRPTRLRELTSFGANPGALRMFAYAPERLPPDAPLVIALHGCTQTADDYDRGTGWSALADEFGFVVVYPQQQPVNNPKNCFSWFVRDDIVRDQREALSIRAMVDHAIKAFATDPDKVFVTGLSAGGAMASVMLATYPEIFAGGAIIAGLPYRCATNAQQAFEAMFTDQSHAPQVLGDRVRAASGHRGPWPKISVWHGANDPIVRPSNGEDIIRQWTNVHGLSEHPSYKSSNDRHMLRVWSGRNGEALIQSFSISNMAHGVPLATTDRQSCGTPGAFFLDVGISSTHHIARFWGLDQPTIEMPNASAMALETVLISTDAPLRLIERAVHPSGKARVEEDGKFERSLEAHSLDPNKVIAAAFKAAGLANPEITTGGLSSKQHVMPSQIIAAALKAAGITQA